MFTPSGLWQIATALPELRDKESAFRTAMDAMGFTYSLPDYAGVRTEAQQAQLVAWRDQAVADARAAAVKNGTDPDAAAKAAYYEVAPPNTTYHEFGAAFDIQITTPDNPTDDDYANAAEIAQGVGLVPGYFFSTPDPFHFQLDYDLATVQQMWTDHTTTVVATVGGISAGAIALIVGGAWLLLSRRGT